jgi:glycosyltransferase involved in cell wall biosynthesis
MAAPSKSPTLTIMVPVYNEADALRTFLPELTEACAGNGWELIIVDDGSTDASSGILAGLAGRPHIRVVRHKVNRGYGGALKTGLRLASTSHVVTVDGDGQHSVDDIGRVFEFAVKEDADLVVGDRGRSFYSGRMRFMAKALIRAFTSLLMRLPIHDLNSGFKLYRTDLVQRYLALCPDSMAFSDVIALTFLSQKRLVKEHPITVRKRTRGASSIGISTAFETVIEILNIIVLFNPLRVFLPLAVLCVAAGVLWGLRFVLMGRGVSTASLLAIILGALAFMIGLIASQLSAIRMATLETPEARQPRQEGGEEP